MPRLLSEPAAAGEAVRDAGRAAVRAAGGEVHHGRRPRAGAARRRGPGAGAPAAVAAVP